MISHCERQRKTSDYYRLYYTILVASSFAQEVTVENRIHNLNISFIGSQDLNVC